MDPRRQHESLQRIVIHGVAASDEMGGRIQVRAQVRAQGQRRRRVDVAQVHGDRVLDVLASMEGDAGRGRSDDDVDFIEGGDEVILD